MRIKDIQYIIGIDTGVNTGIAIWDVKKRQLCSVDSVKIHEAMETVAWLKKIGSRIFVRVEDARQVRFGTDKHKAQGAGSVKRDCKIWEDFLTDLEIDFEMVRPQKARTKWDAEVFKKVTGWKERTSVHGRDAATLVIGK